MKFAVWYDNGTGYFDGAEEVTADSIEAAVAKVQPYQEIQVITAAWSDDPNFGGKVFATIKPQEKK